MKTLKANQVVAGWTGAQWVTVFRKGPAPVLSTINDALNFRLEWLKSAAEPIPYRGDDLSAELLEAAIILQHVM